MLFIDHVAHVQRERDALERSVDDMELGYEGQVTLDTTTDV